MKMQDVTRTIRLNLRLRGYERQMLNAAAAQCGQYVTEFSRDAALERARSVLVGSAGIKAVKSGQVNNSK